MSYLKKLIFLLVFVGFLMGCDGDSPPATPSVTPPHIGPPDPLFLPPNAALIEYDHEMYQIATPVVPSFAIWDGNLTNCLGQDYIVLDISNMGPWGFQRGWIHVTSNTQSFNTGWDETPFHGSGGECPVGNGKESLGPGKSSHLYIPVEYTFGVTTKFDIFVNLCTYLGAESDPPVPGYSNYCPYREYTIEFHIYKYVFVEILREAPCPIGPDPKKYESVDWYMVGDVAELIGVSHNPDWKVLLLNGIPCFFRAEFINTPDEEAAESKNEEFKPGPEKDTSCPKGEKYNEETGECVEIEMGPKCSDYGDRATCGNKGCHWDPKANSGAGGCKD